MVSDMMLLAVDFLLTLRNVVMVPSLFTGKFYLFTCECKIQTNIQSLHNLVAFPVTTFALIDY